MAAIGGRIDPAGTADGASPGRVRKKKLSDEQNSVNEIVTLTAETLPQVWSQIISKSGFAIRGELGRSHEQAISGPNALVIRFPRGYNLPDNARKQQVEEVLLKMTGQTWTIRFENSAAEANGSDHTQPLETPMQRRRRIHEAALQKPLTARAREVLGAVVVDVDEGFGEVAVAMPTLTAGDEDFDDVL